MFFAHPRLAQYNRLSCHSGGRKSRRRLMSKHPRLCLLGREAGSRGEAVLEASMARLVICIV